MGGKKSNYQAKEMNADGVIAYTKSENEVWSFLINRQNEVIKNRACDEFKQALKTLNLPTDHIPQPQEVTKVLQETTGWAVEPVPAVIPAHDFFTLLANKKFPAASFIRSPEEIDYLKEPDIFHEVYGHCPLLTNQYYADFVEAYGKMALEANKVERKYLFRIFWFTIEFGLINTPDGRKIYGGGILSSKKETIAALEGESLEYFPFNIMDALRTPFRIDIVQPLYYYIDSFSQLEEVFCGRLQEMIIQAQTLGDYPPRFTPKVNEKGEHYAN